MIWGKLAIKFPRSRGKICESPKALAWGLLQIFPSQGGNLIANFLIAEENFENVTDGKFTV